jgi:hypothetical protein
MRNSSDAFALLPPVSLKLRQVAQKCLLTTLSVAKIVELL